MKHQYLVLLLGLATWFLLPGCNDEDDWEKMGLTPQGDAAPVEASVEAVEQAYLGTLSQVKSNVQAARKANSTQAPGKATTIVEGELDVAETRLGNVEPSATESRAAQARALAVNEGRVEEARRLYAEAKQTAMDEVVKRVMAEKALDQALADLKQEQARFEREAERLREDLKRLKEAEQSKQALVLRLVGVGFLAVFGLAAGFGGVAGLRLGWVLGLLGLLFLGVAQVVALWWFKWACFGLVSVAVVALAWWVWRQYQANTLAQSLERKTQALKKVVPVLDAAYENVSHESKELREWIDEHIFKKLSSKMDNPDKSAIHQVRSENANQK